MSTTPDGDWFEPIRREVWTELHPILQRFGGYAVGHTGVRQCVGVVELTEEEFEEVLKDIGFKRNWIAALKTRETEHNGKQVSEGSWAYRESFFAKWQIHVTLYEYEGDIIVYAHKEYNWRRRPKLHLEAADFKVEPAKQFVRTRLQEAGVTIN